MWFTNNPSVDNYSAPNSHGGTMIDWYMCDRKLDWCLGMRLDL